MLNDDDDNGNGMPDKNEASPTAGEDDLVELTIDADDSLSGEVELRFLGLDDPDNVKIYGTSARGDPLILPESWNIAALPATGKKIYVEGFAVSGSHGDVELELRHTGVPGAACKDRVKLTVYHVKEVTWETAANSGNVPVDNDTVNNGGRRIFPGKLSPVDADAATRRTVDWVATLEPTLPELENRWVHFKVWDVDDPFDQLYGCPGPTPDGSPCLPDVNLIDANASGGDNRGTEAESLPWPASAQVDNTGQARATFTVSMQPGNNYRAAASCIEDAFVPLPGQAGQTDADAINDEMPLTPGAFEGYKVPVTWSQMLTVWRKLWVEVDSMASEPTTPEQRLPDWDRFDAIELLSGEASTIFDGVGLTNGGPMAAGEVDHYEGGTLRFASPSKDYPVRSNHSYFDSTWGGPLSKIHTDAATSPAEEVDILSGPPGDVHDDDPVSGQLPLFFPVGSDCFIRSAYEPAYIAVDEDAGTNPRRIVSFDLHLEDLELQTGVGYDNAQDVFSESAYWASLLVLVYQPKEAADADPDPFAGLNNGGAATNPNYDESFDFGVTVEDSDNASVVYVEVQRDVGSPIASPIPHDLPHTIAHEVGHAGGAPNDPDVEHDEGGLMSPGAPATECCFSAQTVLRFRESSKW